MGGKEEWEGEGDGNKEEVDGGWSENRNGEGIVVERVRWGRERWRVVGVYVNGDMERILQDI